MSLRFYPACIERADPGFSVFFPDLPGCVSAGAHRRGSGRQCSGGTRHAFGRYGRGRHGCPAAVAYRRSLAGLAGGGDARCGRPRADSADLPGRAIRANITLDEGLLSRLDAAATSEGMSRSGYIAAAVRERLRRQREAA